MSEADSMMKVAEWQQTYYASDSGIHSGATTVRDDESSTDYSGRKKYSSGSGATGVTVPAANATGGGEQASGTLKSPTGEKVIVFMIIIRLVLDKSYLFLMTLSCYLSILLKAELRDIK